MMPLIYKVLKTPEHQLIVDKFSHMEADLQKVRMGIIDIEVQRGANGYAKVENADGKITAIGYYDSYDDTYRCWSDKDYDVSKKYI